MGIVDSKVQSDMAEELKRARNLTASFDSTSKDIKTKLQAMLDNYPSAFTEDDVTAIGEVIGTLEDARLACGLNTAKIDTKYPGLNG